jgi:hypothetical protein
MKKSIILFLLCLPLLALTSCVDDNSFDEMEAFPGEWYGTDSDMSCEFDATGFCYGGRDGSDIDPIILRHCSSTWQFDENTHIEYSLNVYNGTLQLHLYNVDSQGVYNEDYVTVDYYFEDYDHLVIDGYEFEREY